ncbi:Ras GTPase [Orbilia oligospora]|nr:Ras GTPase [Orbilia oligospora]
MSGKSTEPSIPPGIQIRTPWITGFWEMELHHQTDGIWIMFSGYRRCSPPRLVPPDLSPRMLHKHALNFGQITPILEDSHRKQCVIDDDEVALLDVLPVYEANGLEAYPGWFGSVDGYIILYSIASRKSFEEVSAIYEQIRKASGGFSCNILLAGNKCDLEIKREVSTEEGRALAESLGAVFFEVSAKANINIDWSVYDLVRRIKRPDGPRVAKKENNKKEKEGQDEAEGRRKHSFRAASAWVVNKITKRGN